MRARVEVTDDLGRSAVGQRECGSVRQILVVEDNYDLRTLLVDVLTEAGFEVIAARDGAEALELGAAHGPDAIVLDLMMPVMDGPTFLERRRETPWLMAVPVLVLTAHPWVHRVLDGLAPTAVLRKPYNLDELIAAIQILCDGDTGRERVCQA
jgi:two-component system, sensor histidine kinase and response regulator